MPAPALQPQRRDRIRPDWPPGSNVKLLVGQVRTAFGYTAGHPGGPHAVRPAVRQAAAAPVRSFAVEAPPKPKPEDPRDGSPRLLTLLRWFAQEGRALPGNQELGQMLELGVWGRQTVVVLFHRLEKRGAIVRVTAHHGPRQQSAVRLVESGQTIKSANWPEWAATP